MNSRTSSSVTLLSFEHLDAHRSIEHFVSVRHGGVSLHPYASLNLGLHVDDLPDSVLANRGRLAMASGIPGRYFTFARQTHGTHVAVVTEEMRGWGTDDYGTAVEDTDAMVTDVPDICLTILVADCVPILFYDPKHRVVAAAHAGWKGTVDMIGQKTVGVMQEQFGCSLEGIRVGIGPSIGPCCYQVGPEVLEHVESSPGSDGLVTKRTSDGYGYLNLWEANRRQLLAAGIPDGNIEVATLCTCCHPDLFFSHRRDGQTGRFAAGIMLRNEQCIDCTNIVCNWCVRP